MKVTLEKWAEKNMDPVPKQNTLRAWASAGLFDPPAVKMGRTWYVDEDAEYCEPPPPEVEKASERVQNILRKRA